MHKKFVSSFIIPTGIKASVGGYLGDATPFANLIASVSDATLVNPNVVNGGLINYMAEKIVYTEGTVMDEMFRGQIGLKPANGNKIGIVIEKTDDKGAFALIKNTMNAMRAIAGVEIIGLEMTDKKMKAQAKIEKGIAHGNVECLDELNRPIERLLARGVNSIALSVEITAQAQAWKLYYQNRGPNPVGALEAVISHYVVDKYKIPAAHAPIVHEKDWGLNLKNQEVFWRAGAEALTPAYLGCILYGLARAPKIVPKKEGLNVDDISALVVPHSACGGIPIFECMKRKIPIIAVKEIKTNLKVTPESIGIDAIEVDTMYEAIGVLVALKEGISLEPGWRENTHFNSKGI